MCGIAGLVRSDGPTKAELEGFARRMIGPIVHRGPDDSGVWAEPEAGVAFGFRRLAIIDLSEHGHQPMTSQSGRYTMVFNGEIFNHAAFRAELLAAGYTFRGHSDTETALAAFEHWGIRESVRRFIGMFAIAVFDSHTSAVTLIRDRLGIKPLFVAWQPGRLSFGSELKTILADPDFDRSLDPAAVASYLRYLYVPAPASIFRNAFKLLPGHMLTVRISDLALPASEPYWSVSEAAGAGVAHPFEGSEAEGIKALEDLLFDAVQLRLQADVPVGALLSGGIDSSLVVALAQKASDRPLKTYCIGFDVQEFNEAPAAAAVAKHLGTDHTELVVSGREALDVVPLLPALFDEPLANPSQIPTYLVCALARQEVTVALSGDGGDETLAGYHRYIQGRRLIPDVARIPAPVRRALAAGIGAVSSGAWDRAYARMQPLLPLSARHRLPGEKIAKVGNLLAADSEGAMYRTLLSAWQNPADLVRGVTSDTSAVEEALRSFEDMPLLDRMMATDQCTYLADDLLAKVDRASMAVSLEVRVPLLDHRVVELAWTLPHAMKIRGAEGKWVLRQILYKHVPRHLVERPKMGFTVPIAEWLRGPLKPWASELIESGAAEDDLLDRAAVRTAWAAFLNGENRLAVALWAVVQLLAWRREWNV